jgi:hypothetical protein
MGARVGCFPIPRGLPRYSGGSASATSLSRPAQASHTLWPAGSLDRPKRPLSRGFDLAGCPTKPLVSYRTLPTTLRVASSSTGVPRRRGALNATGWLPHSVRGMFSGALKKKHRLMLISAQEQRGRVYRIAGEATA